MSGERLTLKAFVAVNTDSEEPETAAANAASQQLEIDLDLKGYTLERMKLLTKHDWFGGTPNVWEYAGTGVKKED